MNRRHLLSLCCFIASIASLTSISKAALAPPRTKKLVKELIVGERFRRGGDYYHKIADGYYTSHKDNYKDTILLGDACIMRDRDGQISWMGPQVEINS